ncbi:MAG TPA: leucyl aminopeptidase, partial [Candidatus Handelsmanbacteria bacterium]|nr:leucyl aminopeptidase [Candidatus Handelsmanbacteria bacterium]
MHITVLQGEIQKKAADVLVVNLFNGTRPSGAAGAVDRAIGGQIAAAIDLGDFRGKSGETLLLYTQGRIPSPRVLVIGLGQAKDFDLEKSRAAAGTAISALARLGAKNAATILHGTGAGKLPVAAAAQAVAEASLLAAYRFDGYRACDRSHPLKKLRVIEIDRSKLKEARQGIQRGNSIAEATCLARDLINHPGGDATPAYLARTARRLAKSQGLRCQVLDEKGIKRLGMHALLAVGQGSANKPRFIALEHGPKNGAPLVFVGKGITFDSGGLSLKPARGMEIQKRDMAGGAAVLGAMAAIGRLKPNVEVRGLIASAENMPGGNAVRPGDVL